MKWQELHKLLGALRRLRVAQRAVYGICCVLCGMAAAGCVVCAVGVAALLAHAPRGAALAHTGVLAPLLRAFGRLPWLGALPLAEQTLAAALAGLFVLYMTWALLHFVRGLLQTIGLGLNPFHQKNAAALRRLAVGFLAAFFWLPPLGLGLFAVGCSAAYLFRYGAGLYDRASQTIQTQETMILTFAGMVEEKSGQTGRHVKRVSEYSRVLGRQLGLSAAQAETLRLAAMLHDVGKLFIPPEILEKPGKLTAAEFAVIKRHVTDGDRLLRGAGGEVLQAARRIAREHHERWDGTGYLGRRGEEIDPYARIVAVADVFDALTSRRPYKPPWPPERALREIAAGAGSQFDPAVTAALQAAWGEVQQILLRYRDE